RPEERIAVDERADRAHEVALPRQLDLDDLGAEVAEQRRGERRADARPEIEDAKPGERAARRHAPALSRAPRTLSRRGRRQRMPVDGTQSSASFRVPNSVSPSWFETQSPVRGACFGCPGARTAT